MNKIKKIKRCDIFWVLGGAYQTNAGMWYKNIKKEKMGKKENIIKYWIYEYQIKKIKKMGSPRVCDSSFGVVAYQSNAVMRYKNIKYLKQ
jgi:hypothetical protein